MDYISSVPGYLRIGLILSQIAGWSAVAAVFKANLGLDLSGSEFYDVRTAYLVFFVIGTALSIVILVLGLFDYLPPKLAIIITDILWFIAAVILSSYAANEESKIANVLFIDFFFNKGSYGVASAFGFIAAILYLVDAIYYIAFDDDGF